MSDHDDNAEAGLPKPPSFERRVRIPRGHAWGLLLLVCIPVLAIVGVFGSGDRTFNAEGGGVTVALTYAPRLRYGQPAQLKIEVRSTDDRSLRGVRVRVDTSFLDRFGKVSATPEPKRLSAQSYEFAVDDGVAESVLVLDLEPEKYGSATGRVTVMVLGQVVVELPLRTFILP